MHDSQAGVTVARAVSLCQPLPCRSSVPVKDTTRVSSVAQLKRGRAANSASDTGRDAGPITPVGQS